MAMLAPAAEEINGDAQQNQRHCPTRAQGGLLELGPPDRTPSGGRPRMTNSHIESEALGRVVKAVTEVGEGLQEETASLKKHLDEVALEETDLAALHPRAVVAISVFLSTCIELGKIYARYADETAIRGEELGARSLETDAEVAVILNRVSPRDGKPLAPHSPDEPPFGLG